MSDSLRSVLLRAAADVLLRLGEGAPEEAPPAVTVSDGEWQVQVTAARCQQEATGNGSRVPAAPARLTALDRRILRAAPVEEVTLTRLAHLCDGHEPDSYFRGRVRRLVLLGKLVTEFGGYRRG